MYSFFICLKLTWPILPLHCSSLRRICVRQHVFHFFVLIFIHIWCQRQFDLHRSFVTNMIRGCSCLSLLLHLVLCVLLQISHSKCHCMTKWFRSTDTCGCVFVFRKRKHFEDNTQRELQILTLENLQNCQKFAFLTSSTNHPASEVIHFFHNL